MYLTMFFILQFPFGIYTIIYCLRDIKIVEWLTVLAVFPGMICIIIITMYMYIPASIPPWLAGQI